MPYPKVLRTERGVLGNHREEQDIDCNNDQHHHKDH